MKFAPSHQRILLVLAVAFGVGLYAVSLPVRARRQQLGCQYNLKQLGLATLQYTRDYDEKLVLAPSWKSGLRPYIGWPRVPGSSNLFYCPKTKRDYALNVALNQMQLAWPNHPEKLAMYYEPSHPVNADNGTLWPSEGIHDAGSNVCFLDGHVKLLETKPSFWAPELSEHRTPQPKAPTKPTPRRPKTPKATSSD